jgi:hypothetical protein
MMRDRRTTAIAGTVTAALIVAWPDIRGHAVSFVAYSLPRLAAAGAAAAAGMYLRERRNRRAVNAGERPAGEFAGAPGVLASQRGDHHDS